MYANYAVKRTLVPVIPVPNELRICKPTLVEAKDGGKLSIVVKVKRDILFLDHEGLSYCDDMKFFSERYNIVRELQVDESVTIQGVPQ